MTRRESARVKRPTARERDERIIAEAGPWEVDGHAVWPCLGPDTLGLDEDEVLAALCRIANRIARERRKEGKS